MALARSFNNNGAAWAGLPALLAIAALALLLLGGAIPARAQLSRPATPPGWSLCNETSFVLEAAVGRPDGRSIAVQGWQRLRPGECRVAVAAPLARGTHYLYARTSTAHRGGQRQWTGDATLCIDPSRNFRHENPPQCAAMALEGRRFRRVRINRRDHWRTSFAEAQPYTLARARAAGLQRLLTDAGYELPQGRTGIDPRLIAAAIAQFRQRERLAPNTSEEGMIDALATAAQRRSSQLGLTLCNRTQSRIWTAIGRRRGEGWESRGWWPLAPGGCSRTIDDPLVQEVYFVHAAMETPQGERLLAAGGESFCTSPARFAILDRTRCDQRYYNTRYFTQISSQGRSGLVVDFFPRDFLPAGEQPQHVASARATEPTAAPAEANAGARRPPAPLSAGDPAPPPRPLNPAPAETVDRPEGATP